MYSPQSYGKLAGMQSDLIHLPDTNLSGEWRHDKARRRLIIICHGYQGTSSDPTIVTIAKRLNQRGHDTFTFDFSENIGGFDVKRQVEDIASVVKHFESYKEILIIGGSFAALPASIATIEIPAIKGLITLNGFFGRHNLSKQFLKPYVKFRIAALLVPKYRKILKYFKRNLCPDRITVPVLVIHSLADKHVHIKQSRKFYKQLPAPKQFVRLKSASHSIKSARDRQIVVAEIHKWITAKDSPDKLTTQ